MLPKRDASLDFLRGWATIVTCICHFFLFFLPNFTGLIEAEGVLAHMRIHSPIGQIIFLLLTPVRGSPLFCFFNGLTAVQFFFVISSYLLAVQNFRSAHITIVWIGTAKRYVRLLGPVLIATLISYLCLANGLYYIVEVGKINNSPVSLTTGRISPHLGEQHPGDPENPNFFDAFLEGSLLTLLLGNTAYLRSMWFVHYDLLGSGFALLVTCVYSKISQKSIDKFYWNLLLISCYLIPATGFVSPYFIHFPAGVFLAYIHTHSDKTFLHSKVNLLMMCASMMYCCGFYDPVVFYGWLKPFCSTALTLHIVRSYFHAIGSILLVHICVKQPCVNEFISNLAIGGFNVAKYFSRYSSGCYFIGTQLDFSAISWMYIQCSKCESFATNFLCLSLTFIFRLIVLIISAELFHQFEIRNMKIVNRFLKLFQKTNHQQKIHKV